MVLYEKWPTLLILKNIYDKEYQENRAKFLYYIQGRIVWSMGFFWTNIYHVLWREGSLYSGSKELSAVEKCPYWRIRDCTCMKCGIFGTKRTVRNRDVSVLTNYFLYEIWFLWNKNNSVVVLQKCLYYGGRDCVKFGIFRANRTVCIIESSVLWK